MNVCMYVSMYVGYTGVPLFGYIWTNISKYIFKCPLPSSE